MRQGAVDIARVQPHPQEFVDHRRRWMPRRNASAACCELVHEVARSAGEVRLCAHGASMLPAIWPGDELTVRRCGFGELQAGQIALVHRDGKLTAHRIQTLRDSEIVTRGDSLARTDAPVRADEVVGVVTGICRDGRTFDAEERMWQRGAAWILRHSELLDAGDAFCEPQGAAEAGNARRRRCAVGKE